MPREPVSDPMPASSSQRLLIRVFGPALISLSLGGCWVSEGIVGPSTASPARPSLERTPTLLVATTRKPSGDGTQPPWFGSQRGKGLIYAQARLGPPDRSVTGRVAALVRGDWSVGAVGPLTEEGAPEAFAQAALGRDLLLYVHGYRESFESAALSTAELSAGIGFKGATGLFTWPSGAATFDYNYDRESAMWSRDGLEELLVALTRTPSGGKVNIVGHSMGTLLTLETLRMLRGTVGDAGMARIGAVVLASPDIAVDLFISAVQKLGPDARKITVITSTKDRALQVSSRLSGGVARAGAADREKLAVLEDLGVRIADASDYGSGLINHDLFLSSREVQQVVQRAIERGG